MLGEAINTNATAIGGNYSYQDTLVTSQRINWRIEDIIGGDKKFDLSKPFMPESLARVDELDFLTNEEKLLLNQIKGHTYLVMFGLVEEFILPFIVDHVGSTLDQDDYQIRAFLQFASEEAKHIHLFKKFQEEFDAVFPVSCSVIGPGSEIAKVILSHQPLAVALAILGIEWMSQRHYIDSIKDDHELDPQFKSLLKNHWLEEAQHAKLDTLMVGEMAKGMTEDQIASAVGEYLEIGAFLDNGLAQQTTFDLEALERASGRVLTDEQREEFISKQHQSNRWTYVGTALTHPKFLETLEKLSPAQRRRIEEIAPAFC